MHSCGSCPDSCLGPARPAWRGLPAPAARSVVKRTFKRGELDRSLCSKAENVRRRKKLNQPAIQSVDGFFQQEDHKCGKLLALSSVFCRPSPPPPLRPTPLRPVVASSSACGQAASICVGQKDPSPEQLWIGGAQKERKRSYFPLFSMFDSLLLCTPARRLSSFTELNSPHSNVT